MTATEPAETSSAPPLILDIRYEEAGSWPLVLRHLKNVLLMIVTLGLYRFWAVTLMRQLLWRRTRVGDQALEYAGTGLEIFLGFLRVFVIVLLPIGVSFLVIELVLDRELAAMNAAAIEIVDIAYIVALMMLFEMGRFLSWRYRVSRTRWRGIRGRIELPAFKYLVIAAGSAAMIVFSGWFLKPLVDLARAQYVVNALNIGGLKGRYTGGIGALMWLWIGTWVLSGVAALLMIFVGGAFLAAIEAIGSPAISLVTMVLAGLAVIWVVLFVYAIYRVAFWRHVCAHSKVGPASISFTGTARDLTQLTFWNWVILALSLGLLAPITWERKLRYLSKHVTIVGLPDPADLRQVEEDISSVGGEGLAGDFDIA